MLDWCLRCNKKKCGCYLPADPIDAWVAFSISAGILLIAFSLVKIMAH